MNGPLVIVGDVLLDREVTGTVDRLCPEAPVPVLAETGTADRPAHHHAGRGARRGDARPRCEAGCGYGGLIRPAPGTRGAGAARGSVTPTLPGRH